MVHSPCSPAFITCSDDYRARFWYRRNVHWDPLDKTRLKMPRLRVKGWGFIFNYYSSFSWTRNQIIWRWGYVPWVWWIQIYCKLVSTKFLWWSVPSCMIKNKKWTSLWIWVEKTNEHGEPPCIVYYAMYYNKKKERLLPIQGVCQLVWYIPISTQVKN